MPVYQPDDILLDKFRIERLLGQGAIGEVYLATHIKLNGQRAVKVLRADTPGFSAPQRLQDARERFELEARLYEHFHGSDLVQVFDFEEDHGVLLLSMEYMPGGSLAARIEAADRDRTPMPVDEVVRIGGQIADALAALHQRDVIHRDLHPGNILFDRDGRARLADLGLAQVPGVFSQRYGVSSALLSVHPGHPNFRSPEHNIGSQALKPPSDIYMLGACLFLALTGRDYHNQRPGTRASSLRADTPAWLDDLLISMLAKDPEQRPWDGRSAAERLRQGRRHAAREQLQRERQQAAERQRRQTWWQQNAKWLAVGAAAALSLFGLMAVILLWASNSLQARSLQETQIVLAVQDTQAVQNAQPTPAPPQPQAASPTETPEMITATPSMGSTQVSPQDGMLMLYVPAGEFWMGSDKSVDPQANDDELPQHRVYLDAYWIDQTEVTNAMYARCVADGACTPPAETSSYSRDSYYGSSQFDQYPVIYVDWNQASAYCAWAGRRLPSEAEWEKAARGTDGRIYPWGKQAPNGQLLNFNGNEKDTTAVGQYPAGASPYGALDMAGNVWEWVADWYGDYPSGAVSNPTGPGSGEARVFRGGSWGDASYGIRAAYRVRSLPGYRNVNFGFRCAR